MESKSLFSRKNLKWGVLVTGLIIAIVSVFYAPFRHNFFAYDDFRYIENLFSTRTALFFGYNTTRFLSNLIFVPLYALFGFDPLGYNLFDAALHILNSVLLAAIATRLSGKILVGGLTGILFASSAALADALLWKACINSLMSTCFVFLAFYQYLRWREAGDKWRRIAGLVLFIAALYSKEDAAAFPLFICIYELIFRREKWSSIRFAVPYALVVGFYVVTAQILIRVFTVRLEHYERFLSFRPLYALFAGFSTFLMQPDGRVTNPGQAIAVGVALVIVAFFWVRDRRLLLFALVGIFVTFLPSSLSSLGLLEPRNIFESVSRYLYAPSAMAALSMACVLGEFVTRMRKRFAVPLILCILCIFVGYNFKQVEKRGVLWGKHSEMIPPFLSGVKRSISQFPPHSYVFAIDPPTGRAYVQQSLRAFYKNPDITWIVDPLKFTVPPGANAFILICSWGGPDYMDVKVFPFEWRNLIQF